MNRFYLLILLFCFSCSVIINTGFGIKGIYEENVEGHKFEKENREIVLIPMKHIAPKEFYAHVGQMVDSLKQKGYYFFWEGVAPDNRIDSLKLDTLARKIRKIWGRELANNSEYGGSIDTLKQTIRVGEKTYPLKRKVMMQPAYNKMNIDFKTSRNVDISLEEYVNIFEAKFGKIVLTSCDYQTSLFEEYHCAPIDWKYRKKVNKEITLTARNENVVNEILKDSHSKIAVIYGAAHVPGIIELLEKEGYKKVD